MADPQGLLGKCVGAEQALRKEEVKKPYCLRTLSTGILLRAIFLLFHSIRLIHN